MAQLVEHIVHIDGVTGSSPVATTTTPENTSFFGDFSYPLFSVPARQGHLPGIRHFFGGRLGIPVFLQIRML